MLPVYCNEDNGDGAKSRRGADKGYHGLVISVFLIKTMTVVQRIEEVQKKEGSTIVYVIISASPTTRSLTTLPLMKNFQNSLVV